MIKRFNRSDKDPHWDSPPHSATRLNRTISHSRKRKRNKPPTRLRRKREESRNRLRRRLRAIRRKMAKMTQARAWGRPPPAAMFNGPRRALNRGWSRETSRWRRIVRKGYRIPWKDCAPKAFYIRSRHPGAAKMTEAVYQERDEQLALGALILVRHRIQRS